jgi:hypothetical protein
VAACSTEPSRFVLDAAGTEPIAEHLAPMPVAFRAPVTRLSRACDVWAQELPITESIRLNVRQSLRPRLYRVKWHHPLSVVRYAATFSSTCPYASPHDVAANLERRNALLAAHG